MVNNDNKGAMNMIPDQQDKRVPVREYRKWGKQEFTRSSGGSLPSKTQALIQMITEVYLQMLGV